MPAGDDGQLRSRAFTSVDAAKTPNGYRPEPASFRRVQHHEPGMQLSPRLDTVTVLQPFGVETIAMDERGAAAFVDHGGRAPRCRRQRNEIHAFRIVSRLHIV